MELGETEYRLCEAGAFLMLFLGHGFKVLGSDELGDECLCASLRLELRQHEILGAAIRKQEMEEG